MKFEKIPNPLNEENKAHEEANMMRVIGTKGDPMAFEKIDKPRSKDYDQALKALEELKQMAENEPEMKKLLAKIEQISIKGGFLFMAILTEVINAVYAEFATIFKDNVNLYRGAQVYGIGEELIKKIDSASIKLEVLRKEANTQGVIENYSHEIDK